MKKDVLKYIKDSMKAYRSSKKELEAELKKPMAEIEKDRKAALKKDAEYAARYYGNGGGIDNPVAARAFANMSYYTNRDFDQRSYKLFNESVSRWHNDETFYLIYADGSSVNISAEEILTGEQKFPKLTGIVYAHMQDADGEMDTENGELNWDFGTDEGFEAKDNYDTAIEIKFATNWGKKQDMTVEEAEQIVAQGDKVVQNAESESDIASEVNVEPELDTNSESDAEPELNAVSEPVQAETQDFSELQQHRIDFDTTTKHDVLESNTQKQLSEINHYTDTG